MNTSNQFMVGDWVSRNRDGAVGQVVNVSGDQYVMDVDFNNGEFDSYPNNNRRFSRFN